MASVSQRTYGWLAAAFALLAATSVAHAAFKTTAPKDVTFAGLWKINAELSDNAKNVIDRKRGTSSSGTTYTTGKGGRGATLHVPDAGEILGTMGGMDRSYDPDDPRCDDRHTGTSPNSTSRNDPMGECSRVRQHETVTDPEHEEKMQALIDQLRAPPPDDIEIDQRPDALSIQSADATNSCKPGEKSQVLLPGTVIADRECGWEGNTFVIEVKAKTGATRTDRYTLSKGGDRLTISTKLSGSSGKYSGLEIKHVYDRAVSLLR